MTKINVGIIGLGHMGLLHMKNCLHMDDVKVVAAADISERLLEKAKSFGVRNLYSDYHELLNKRNVLGLDSVIISLPNFLHYESIQSASEAGINILVEKPMATNIEESKEIVRSTEKNHVKFMVAHSMRFIDAVEKMKTYVDKGNIGDLEIITIESIQNGPFNHGLIPKPISQWWFDPEKSGGGALLDIGYHLIDLFRLFAGDCAILYSYLDHKYNLPVEDGATVVLKSSSSPIRGIINIGWFEKTIFPRLDFRLILHGNADYLSSDELIPKNIYVHAIKEGTKNFFRRAIGRQIKYLSYTYYYESYFKELTYFLNCIREDTVPVISAIDGLRTIEIISEVYRLFNQSKDMEEKTA